MNVQAVILAGGEGMRLRPLTRSRPKVLLPAGGKPILGHVLDAAVAAGIRDITVVVGYRKEQVMKYLNNYPVPTKVVIQKKQLGTFDALAAAKDEVTADRLLILPGDNYINATSIRDLLAVQNGVLVAPHQHPWNYGVVIQRNGVYCSTDIYSKDMRPGSLVETGAYVLERQLYEELFKLEEPDAVLLTMEVSRHNVRVVEANEWYDADNPADFLELNRHLLSKQTALLRGTVDQRATIRGHVVLGKNVSVGPGAVINGPAIIGDDCMIHSHVCIEPGTSLGARVEVEPFTYLKNSVIMNDTVIGAQSRIVDSVIGEGCVFESVATSSRAAVGAVVGDRAAVGAFTRLCGVRIGNNAVIDGGKLISTDIPDDTRVM